MKIKALVEEELDDAWELLDVDYPGRFIGDGRQLEQQSTLRGGGNNNNNNNMRRLNKTLYLPVMVTVRGRADMADMAPLLIMQAMNNNLKLMLLYLKSINANAFGSVQLSVSELDVSNIGDKEPDTAPPTPSPNSSTVQSTTDNTNAGGETNNSNTNNDSNTSPGGTPFWVWIIVVLVCVALGICILCGICKSGMCLCCTDCCSGKCKRRHAKEYDYELQKQLAIERWKQQPASYNGNGGGGDALTGLVGVSRNGSRSHQRSSEKREVRGGNRRHHSDVNPRRRSDRARRHHHDDRRHSEGRKRRSDRARSDGYVGSRVGGGHASRRTSNRRSRPMVRRSKSVTEIMMEKEELGNIEEERSRVENEHAHQPVLTIPYGDPEDENPYVIPNTALVVYEPARNALEPEAPKIEDVAPVTSTAIVLVEPPKEPEGEVAPKPPKRKSRQKYHHDKDNMYICPTNDLPEDVRNKHQVPQDERRRSRRKRSSYSDKFKDSFRRKKEDHHFSDYYVVLDTLGTESNSGSFERVRKDKGRKKKKKKKKKSKHKRRSKHDDDGGQLSDTGYESPPSITTNNPNPHDDGPSTQKSPMGRRLSVTGRLFASFRRSGVEMEISDDDDDC